MSPRSKMTMWGQTFKDLFCNYNLVYTFYAMSNAGFTAIIQPSLSSFQQPPPPLSDKILIFVAITQRRAQWLRPTMPS